MRLARRRGVQVPIVGIGRNDGGLQAPDCEHLVAGIAPTRVVTRVLDLRPFILLSAQAVETTLIARAGQAGAWVKHGFSM
jgi:hypothetical protein